MIKLSITYFFPDRDKQHSKLRIFRSSSFAGFKLTDFSNKRAIPASWGAIAC